MKRSEARLWLTLWSSIFLAVALISSCGADEKGDDTTCVEPRIADTSPTVSPTATAFSPSREVDDVDAVPRPCQHVPLVEATAR